MNSLHTRFTLLANELRDLGETLAHTSSALNNRSCDWETQEEQLIWKSATLPFPTDSATNSISEYPRVHQEIRATDEENRTRVYKETVVIDENGLILVGVLTGESEPAPVRYPGG